MQHSAASTLRYRKARLYEGSIGVSSTSPLPRSLYRRSQGVPSMTSDDAWVLSHFRDGLLSSVRPRPSRYAVIVRRWSTQTGRDRTHAEAIAGHSLVRREPLLRGCPGAFQEGMSSKRSSCSGKTQCLLSVLEVSTGSSIPSRPITVAQPIRTSGLHLALRLWSLNFSFAQDSCRKHLLLAKSLALCHGQSSGLLGLLPRRIVCVFFGTELARDDVDNVGRSIISLSKILFVAVASHTSKHRHGLDASHDSAGSVHNLNLRTICDLSLSIVGFVFCSAGWVHVSTGTHERRRWPESCSFSSHVGATEASGIYCGKPRR